MTLMTPSSIFVRTLLPTIKYVREKDCGGCWRRDNNRDFYMTLCYTGIPTFLSQDSNKGLFAPIDDMVGKDLLTPLQRWDSCTFLYMNSLSSRKFFYDIKKAEL